MGFDRFPWTGRYANTETSEIQNHMLAYGNEYQNVREYLGMKTPRISNWVDISK